MIKIDNPENIPQFRAKSKLHNKIGKVCRKFDLYPTIQVFRSKDEGSEYRGVTIGDQITLYWSGIETTDSVLWVFCHELRHVMFNTNPTLYEAIVKREVALTEEIIHKKIRKMPIAKAYKVLCETGITELLCDIFATEEIGKDYGDSWFPIRLKRKEKKKCRK